MYPAHSREEPNLTKMISIALLWHGQSDLMCPEASDLVPPSLAMDAGPAHTAAGGLSTELGLLPRRSRGCGIVQLVVLVGLYLLQLECLSVIPPIVWRSDFSQDRSGRPVRILRLH